MFAFMGAVIQRVMVAIERICCAILLVMTVVIIILVFTRNILGFSYPWSEEVTRYLLVWLSMLGAVVLLQRDDHISINFMGALLPPRAAAALALVLRVLTFAFMLVLAHQGWLTAVARGRNHSPAMDLSLFWPYAAIPVAAVLMAIVALYHICSDFRRVRTGRKAGE